MKKLGIVFMVLTFLGMNCLAQEKKDRYSSELGKYSIDYIGKITENTSETDKITSYKITFNSSSMNYLIVGTKHIYSLENSTDELLNVSITSFNDKVNGNISQQHDILLNHVKGKYALINLMDSQVKIELYAYMNNNYQYQLVAYAEESVYDQEEVDAIFNSFEIIE